MFCGFSTPLQTGETMFFNTLEDIQYMPELLSQRFPSTAMTGQCKPSKSMSFDKDFEMKTMNILKLLHQNILINYN